MTKENIEIFNKYIINRMGFIWNRRFKRLLTPGKNARGYMRVHLYLNKQTKSFFVHRLVALKYVKNPDNKPHVNHIDGDKLNNYYKNLEWCTPLENTRHALENKLYINYGEAVSKKLTTKNVKYILERSDIAGVKLAKMFNVTPAMISNIRKGKAWKHLQTKK